MINISKAIVSLGVDLSNILSIVGDQYEGIEWLGEPLLTKEEIEAEVARLNTQFEANEYQRLREAEYPDFRDYLDGIVKGDQAQIDDYIQKCLAVKAKYPKPT